MDVSVLIPTHGRPEKLRACLAGLARQTSAAGSFEILIGVDGPDRGEGRVAAETLPPCGVPFAVSAFERRGPAATRNRLLERARGRLLLWLNDDVRPDAALVRTHAEAHAALGGRTAMVLGASPWVVHQPDRLFDRLVRETSMVFFYDQMTGPRAADPDHDWGFRHAWTLNLSLPAEAARAVGGFCDWLPRAVYEDLEFAYRVRERTGSPVLYRPGAVVKHDHRYEPLGILRRDVVLGYEAVNLARRSPGCAREMFRRDMAGAAEAGYAMGFVEREERAARRNIELFCATAGAPATVADGPHGGLLVRLAFEQAVLARRWLFYTGLVGAVQGRSVEDAQAWAGVGEPGGRPEASAVDSLSAAC